MKRLVNSDRGKASGLIRQQAIEIIRNVPPKKRGEIAHAVWAWVKANIAYIRDTNGMEQIHYPEQVLKQRAGDCDDHSLLLASLLESVGIRTRFKAVGFRPGSISHVYTQAHIGPHWISLETTEPVSMGWQPPGIVEKMIIRN
jgi:transglutaminase-like putative cysteine protease